MSTAQTYRGLRIDNILVCTEESKKKKVFYNGGKFLKNISNHLYNRDSGQGHGKKKKKHPQVFTQNCSHLHMYGKKHSRASPEAGNDYLKIQMKHSKGLHNSQKTLMVIIVPLPSPEAATYLPRNVLTYYFQVCSCLFQCCPRLFFPVS